MSSTSGLEAGNLLGEIARLRVLLERARRRARAASRSRDMWKARAVAAESMLANQERERRAWDRRMAA